MDQIKQTKGFGAARKTADKAPIGRYCISPQLAPSMLTPREKEAYASSENYHAGRKGK